jgi:hypothetical protein
LQKDLICEYPVEPKPLAWELTKDHITPSTNGQIQLPDAPGLGLVPDPVGIRKYLVDTEIKVNGRILYRTPTV